MGLICLQKQLRPVLLVFIFLGTCFANSTPGVVALPIIPTGACDGAQGQGSATVSTEYPGNTESVVNIWVKDPVNLQNGVQWKLWSSPEVRYDSIGQGSPDAPLESLLHINSDERSVNFNITEPNIFKWQSTIILQVSQPTQAELKGGEIASTAEKTPRSTTATTHITSTNSPDASTTRPFVITATGYWPCALGGGNRPTFGVTKAAPSIATECLQNRLPLNSDAWHEFKVDSYISSVYASATKAPGHEIMHVASYSFPDARINMRDALREDSAVTQVCLWNEQCNPIECGDVRGQTNDVDVTDPARFLAYNSFANLSNVFWRIHEAMLAAEGRVESHAGDLIGTFFTKTPAKSSWARILGLSTAVYSMLITIAAIAFPGFFAANALVKTVLWFVPTTETLVGASEYVKPLEITEESWNETSTLDAFIGDFISNMTGTVHHFWDAAIGHVNLENYHDLVANGSGLENYDSPGSIDSLSDKIRQDVSTIFNLRAINWVLEQENSFIIWAAYGRRLEMHSDSPYIIRNSKPDKVYENFTQKDCEEHFQGGHNGTVFTNCNAGEDGNKGMGRILQLSNKLKPNSYRSAVKGWDSGYTIPGGWKFNLPDVIDGSVRSWQAGGFNFSFDSMALKHGTTIGNVLRDFHGTPQQAGMFTLPVLTSTWSRNNEYFYYLAGFPTDAKKDPTGYNPHSISPFASFKYSCYKFNIFNGTQGKCVDFVTSDLRDAINEEYTISPSPSPSPS